MLNFKGVCFFLLSCLFLDQCPAPDMLRPATGVFLLALVPTATGTKRGVFGTVEKSSHKTSRELASLQKMEHVDHKHPKV